MLKILEALVNLVVTIFNLLFNILSAFIQLIEFLFNSVSSIIVYTAYMPPWLLSFVILGIMILVIKFSLNILKGGAKQ